MVGQLLGFGSAVGLPDGVMAVAEQTNPAAPAPASASQSAPDELWSVRASKFSPFEWVTRPSRDALMGFSVSTDVRELLAKPGQKVKKGELLVRGRDGEALAALVSQRIRAANRAPIDSAKAGLELAEVRYKRILEAAAENATNPQEIDERRVSVDAAKAQLDNAIASNREEESRILQLDENLQRFRLEAPFDGVIDQVVVDEGSTIEPPQPVLRLVSIDPMWVDLPVPVDETVRKNLKQGDQAWVLLDLPQAAVVASRVLHVSPVADAGAGTRIVRVEIPNPMGYPPGTRARVRFERPAADQLSSAVTPAQSSVPAGGAR
jgi:RND family efflux transporter MFP subunit